MNALITNVSSSLYQSFTTVTDSTTQDVNLSTGNNDYIELPDVTNYQELEMNPAFPEIKQRFLDDINNLKRLAFVFVNNQYDSKIATFYDKLSFPDIDNNDILLLLYRDTRFQIHKMVMILDNQEMTDDNTKAHIASILHECLNDIDMCFTGFILVSIRASYTLMIRAQDYLE